tara:strand:- start:6867 stop:7085 length:219 start_codon:yes stop_codon:yes gene_type:complete
MSDGRGQEYLDENLCLHENVYIDGFEIINKPDPTNPSADVLITLRCEKCGDTQEHTLDLEDVIYDLDLGWNE